MREFRDGDGAALRAFWQACGIKIRPADDDAALARFATLNPGTFLLAIERGIAGSALGGWDGRREPLRAAGCPKINLTGHTRATTVEFERQL